MKIIIKNFKIIDFIENKFGEFTFSDSVNILSGNNKRGKSTLIKAIMYSLGFNIKKWASNFNLRNFIFIIELTIDNKILQIFRYNDNWIINNRLYNLKEYREFLKELLNINVELKGRNNIFHIPYPTDLLLYNYIDQDTSFTTDLYKSNHKDIAMYGADEIYKILEEYLELSNKKILELKNKKNKLKAEKNLQVAEKKVIKNVIAKYSADSSNPFSLDPEVYKNEILRIEKLTNEFLKKRNELEQKKYKTLNNIKNLNYEKIQLESIFDELEQNTARVHCKFCHSNLSESFEEKYQRELNKNAIIIQYLDVKNELKDFDEELQLQEKEIEKCENELYEIEKLFNENKHNLKLAEIIQKSIFSEIRVELENNSNEIEEKINKNKEDIQDIGKIITKEGKKLENRKKEIINFYKEKINEIKSISEKIDLTNLQDNFMKFKNSKTGADGNINTVIIYYIYLSILEKYSKVQFPIVWDSFIKEVLDGDNAKNMDKLVNDKILKLNMQIICSYVPNTSKEVKIEIEDKYNIININSRLCSKEITEKEQKIVDNIFYVLKEKKE